jgi:CheY-like chemotaxis protein
LSGGTVEARSKGEGAGSTFCVRLEMVEPSDAAQASAKLARPRGAASRRRILVADDNRDAAQTLAMMLELDGHEVRVAYDGREALQIAEEFLPQVALLDIGMPNMDGCQTARHIRQRPWGRSVMLVALTGWGQAQDRENATEAGFDRHLVKPYSGETLQGLIDEALRRDASGETSAS